MHSLNLRVIGEQIGPGTLDDLLNLQYEESGGNPVLAAKYVTDVLRESFHVDAAQMVYRIRLGVDPD